jgi:hypothetical protein
MLTEGNDAISTRSGDDDLFRITYQQRYIMCGEADSPKASLQRSKSLPVMNRGSNSCCSTLAFRVFQRSPFTAFDSSNKISKYSDFDIFTESDRTIITTCPRFGIRKRRYISHMTTKSGSERESRGHISIAISCSISCLIIFIKILRLRYNCRLQNGRIGHTVSWPL